MDAEIAGASPWDRTPAFAFGQHDEIVGQAPAQGEALSFGHDDPIAKPLVPRNAARAEELAQHRVRIEGLLSGTVPLRVQHPRLVETAAGLIANHGVAADEALERAAFRLHDEEGTGNAGGISDVIGNEGFDEIQRAAAPANLAQPAQGVGRRSVAAQDQADPNGQYAPGSGAPRNAEGATLDHDGDRRAENGRQAADDPASAAGEGERRAEELKFGQDDEVVAHSAGAQNLLPGAEGTGDEDRARRTAPDERGPKQEEKPPDKGPLSDESKQSVSSTAPRPQGGVSDSAADPTATGDIRSANGDRQRHETTRPNLGRFLNYLLGVSEANAAALRPDPSQVGRPIVESGGSGGPFRGGGSTSGGQSPFRSGITEPARPNITTPYSRPPRATTRVQQGDAQGHPCSSCGKIAPKMYANHIRPLVKEYYETGTIDTARMRSPEATNAHCPTCSARQGGFLSHYSRQMKRLLGLD